MQRFLCTAAIYFFVASAFGPLGAFGQTLYPIVGRDGANYISTQLSASKSGVTTPTAQLNGVKMTTVKDFYGTGGVGITTSTGIVVVSGSGLTPANTGLTTATLNTDYPVTSTKSAPNIMRIGVDATAWTTSRTITGTSPIVVTPSSPNNVAISYSGVTPDPINSGITTVTLNSMSPVMIAKSAPNNAVISIASNAFLTSQTVTAGQSMTVTPSLTGVRVATTADPGGYGITTTSITGTGAATVTPSAPNLVVVNVPTGAGLTTPSLQQVTDVGNVTNTSVTITARNFNLGTTPNPAVITLGAADGSTPQIYTTVLGYLVMVASKVLVPQDLEVDGQGIFQPTSSLTPPINVTGRPALVTDLNADLLDSYHARDLLSTASAAQPANSGITTTTLKSLSPLFFTMTSPNNALGSIASNYFLTSTSAILDSQLSANVPLLNATLNTFAHSMTINGNLEVGSGALFDSSVQLTNNPPMAVSFNTRVANLNADLLDGYHASDLLSTFTAATPSWQAVTNVGNTTTQNVGTTGTFTASGNILGGSNISAAGIVRGSELSTSYTVTASGNVQSGNNIKAVGIVTGNNGLATSGPLSVSGQAQFSGGIALTGSGGANQVVKQASTGAAFTVGTLASTNLSDTSNLFYLNAANSVSGAPQTMTANNAQWVFSDSSSSKSQLVFNNSGPTNYMHINCNADGSNSWITLGHSSSVSGTPTMDFRINDAGNGSVRNILAIGTATVASSGATCQTTSLAVGGGSTVLNHYSGTGASGILSITNIADSSFTITVTGATTGDTVCLGAPSTLETNVNGFGFVSASNTVTVRLSTGVIAGVTIASATWRADTWHH